MVDLGENLMDDTSDFAFNMPLVTSCAICSLGTITLTAYMW